MMKSNLHTRARRRAKKQNHVRVMVDLYEREREIRLKVLVLEKKKTRQPKESSQKRAGEKKYEREGVNKTKKRNTWK